MVKDTTQIFVSSNIVVLLRSYFRKNYIRFHWLMLKIESLDTKNQNLLIFLDIINMMTSKKIFDYFIWQMILDPSCPLTIQKKNTTSKTRVATFLKDLSDLDFVCFYRKNKNLINDNNHWSKTWSEEKTDDILRTILNLWRSQKNKHSTTCFLSKTSQISP